MSSFSRKDFASADKTPHSQPVLNIRDLNVAFRTDGRWNDAVKSLDLEIGKNETVAVVGESGSGKSVSALSIMRLLPQANSRVSGLIELNGRDLMGLGEEAMRDVRGNEVSMIFQEPMTSLNPTLTIGFQIAEALRCHQRDIDTRTAFRKARELLDRVRIPNAPERFHNYPHQFSGGMRQRVMIAMALACRPGLLIADEPTTALDVTIQAQILDLIRYLQAEIGMSVLFITHDMGVVAEIADRVVVMYGGEKVEENARDRIFSSPEHPYTRVLLDAVPRLGADDNAREQKCDSPAKLPEMIAYRNGAITVESISPQPLLDVSELTVRFPVRGGPFNRLKGRIHAVENVSFTIDAGETLAFVGESGCGKTTVGRTMLGLTAADSGRIVFDGEEMTRLTGAALRAKRRHMQVIFQDPFASLNPRQSVGSAISEPMRVHGLADRLEARDKAAALLKKVGLPPEAATRLPHEFSGGQRQRICIARALALEPRLIVADESVSALDVSIRQRILDLMIGLQEELGLALLFISHDIAVVERIAHRIAVLYLGEIVEIGPCQSVLRNPQHSYTRRLLEAVPRLDLSRRRLTGHLATDEIPSPLKATDYLSSKQTYREIGNGHFVQLG